MREALSRFSSEHLLTRKLGKLSGGELQRVLLAIAMTPVPNLLLLDEPASGIDARGLASFYREITALREENDISVILVTHDLRGAAEFSDRMLLLDRKVLVEGKPSEVVSCPHAIEIFGKL